jgi:hypothetical protein
VSVFPVDIEKADYVVLNAATYPWRSLPGVTMARDGERVVVTMPDGHAYPFVVAAEKGDHVALRRAEARG